MAEKHKSKYKAPKDLEKSQKPKTRKDLKDYTHDDKEGALNPKSTGEKQSNVLRKTDKEVVDDGKYDVKYNADDRLYTDLEDGEYDPKHAAKVFKKRQDKDETETADVLKDKIENLTREQKERLVREYIRRKIENVLKEAEEETAAAEETPSETPKAPADVPTDTTTPEAPADIETPTEPTPTAPPAAEPAAAAAPAQQATPEELENRVILNAGTELASEGSIGKIKLLSKIINISMKEVDPEDQANFYRLLRAFAIKKLTATNVQTNNKE